MNRKEILTKAEEYICKDRNTSYGEPENNFQNIANLWNSYLIAKCGVCIPKLEAVDVGIMMTLLKVARMASGNKEDNFIDAAGYIACAGEIATKPKTNIFNTVWEEFQAQDKPTEKDADKGDVFVGTPSGLKAVPYEEFEKFWNDVLTSNGDVD